MPFFSLLQCALLQCAATLSSSVGGTLDLGGVVNGIEEKMPEMGEMFVRLPSGGADEVGRAIRVDTGVF